MCLQLLIMKKFNYFTIIGFSFSLLLTGCTHGKFWGEGIASSVDKYQYATSLVRDNWKAFAQFRRQDFAERISNDFIPDKKDFLNDVEKSFYSATPINLFFTIDKVLESQDKMSISFSWKKKVADRDTSVMSLKKGAGTIVFINQNDQWLIYRIDGTSIFMP